jgi:hypothetical protein
MSHRNSQLVEDHQPIGVESVSNSQQQATGQQVKVGDRRALEIWAVVQPLCVEVLRNSQQRGIEREVGSKQGMSVAAVEQVPVQVCRQVVVL